MWVRGLKLPLMQEHLRLDYVASYVGAWIETPNLSIFPLLAYVASYVGAWIETCRTKPFQRWFYSRILCGCVN